MHLKSGTIEWRETPPAGRTVDLPFVDFESKPYVHMAVIRNVSVLITPRLHGCISRPTAGNSSGLASSSSGAYRMQLNAIPILKRACKGLGLEQIEFESSCRISGKNWKGWARRIPSTADILGGCRTSAENRELSAVDEEVGVMEGDVVEYPAASGAGVGHEGNDNGRRIGVGVVVDMVKESDVLLCQIEPLCQEDPGSKEWIHDESEPDITVPIGQVRVLQAWYSQRMVPDRISNPHGEHAENLWILE